MGIQEELIQRKLSFSAKYFERNDFATNFEIKQIDLFDCLLIHSHLFVFLAELPPFRFELPAFFCIIETHTVSSDLLNLEVQKSEAEGPGTLPCADG